jgi:hypothetical protein
VRRAGLAIKRDPLHPVLILVLGRPRCASAGVVLDRAIMVFGAAPGAARLHRPHALLHDLLHPSQRVLNLGTIGDLPGGEFVSAQTAGQIGPKVKFPQPDLEHLVAVRTGQSDPHASMIFEQVALFG